MNAASDDIADRSRRTTAAAFDRERRRSKNVRRLKIALPAVAALLLAALVVAALLPSFMGGVSIDIAGSTIRDGKLIMANPRLGGFSETNRPFEVKAARAIQEIANDQIVELEEIAAKLPLGGREWATVATERGLLSKADNTLTVTTPILVKTTDGVVARLSSAVLNIDEGDLRSDAPVQIDYEGSRVTADSLTVTDGGEVMVFENRVKVKVEGGRINTASAAADGANNAQN